MRATLRLLAKVRPSKYLENFAPTGLTGLTTHPNPRPSLIYLYTSTLEKLKSVPESSVYRQSTEALTRKRLNIVESVKPAGFDAWLQRVQAVVAENPDAYEPARRPDGTYAAAQKLQVETPEGKNWDGEIFEQQTEGAYLNEEEMQARLEQVNAEIRRSKAPKLKWETEPSLEATQIAEIENQIGAGLIEEVVQVAQGELKLVDEMVKNKVWEELVEKPKPGQWTYFERSTPSEAS